MRVAAAALALLLAAAPSASVAVGPAALEESLPEPVVARLAAGDAFMAAFDSRRAAEEYEKALAAAPESYTALAKTAIATRDAAEQLRVEKKKEAEAWYERALARAHELVRRFPDRAEAHYLVASTSGQLALYRGGGEKVRLSREVERYAKQAAALDPSDGRPHAVLGVYYREVANASAFLKVIARNLLGGLPNGTNEDAVRELTLAVELGPTDVYARYELARTYEIMKKRDLEIETLRQVVAMAPVFERDARLKRQASERLAALGAP